MVLASPHNSTGTETYTLNAYVAAQFLTSDGAIGARVEYRSGNTIVKRVNCLFTNRSTSFMWRPFNCNIGPAGTSYDSMTLILGQQNITSGFLAFDTVSLTEN